jgi:hypothetical protein
VSPTAAELLRQLDVGAGGISVEELPHNRWLSRVFGGSRSTMDLLLS